MIYSLLKRVIESQNPYISNDKKGLYLMNFLITEDITEDQYNELDVLLNREG